MGISNGAVVKPNAITSYHISLDGLPYQGEQDAVEPAPPRNAYHSPITRNKIKIGHPLDHPILIEGNRNLRSHIDRILTRLSEGQNISTIQITRL